MWIRFCANFTLYQPTNFIKFLHSLIHRIYTVFTISDWSLEKAVVLCVVGCFGSIAVKKLISVLVISDYRLFPKEKNMQSCVLKFPTVGRESVKNSDYLKERLCGEHYIPKQTVNVDRFPLIASYLGRLCNLLSVKHENQLILLTCVEFTVLLSFFLAIINTKLFTVFNQILFD